MKTQMHVSANGTKWVLQVSTSPKTHFATIQDFQENVTCCWKKSLRDHATSLIILGEKTDCASSWIIKENSIMLLKTAACQWEEMTNDKYRSAEMHADLISFNDKLG